MSYDEQERALARAAAPALAAIAEDSARAPKWLRPLFAAVRDLLFDPDLDLDRVREAAGFVDPVHRKGGDRDVWLALREVVGQPGWSYLRDGRLETAAHLLLETGMSIAEAGYLVGYTSAPSFRRLLRAFLGMPPSRYRRRARRRLRRAGPAPAGAETTGYWQRLLAGELSGDEARSLDAYLGHLAPEGAPAADEGRERSARLRRSLAEGLAETLDGFEEIEAGAVLPFADQRRLVREAVWFPDSTFFQVLSERGAAADPGRGLELARLAVDSLAGNHLLEADPALAALAWARLARARWRAGDRPGARHDLERSAREAERADADPDEDVPPPWDAERSRVAAAFAWRDGRPGEALELAEGSVARYRAAHAAAGSAVFGADLAAALVLRAELRAAAADLEPESPGARIAELRAALTDLEEARTLAAAAPDGARPRREAALSLQVRLLAALAPRAEIAAALPALRRAAAGLGPGLAARLTWLEGHASDDPEPLWREARQRFAGEGDDLATARATLDLARLCLAESRPGEAAALATELAMTLETAAAAAGEEPEPLPRPAPFDEVTAEDLDRAEDVLKRLEWPRRAERALDLAL